MSSCTYDPYTLPAIDFVAGETQDFAFHVYFHDDDKPFSLSGCDANFSVVSFTNRVGKPILSKEMGVTAPSEGSVDNVLTVTLLPKETVNLSGKYIYQISIRDEDGEVEIPKQGVLYITNNINKAYITNSSV